MPRKSTETKLNAKTVSTVAEIVAKTRLETGEDEAQKARKIFQDRDNVLKCTDLLPDSNVEFHYSRNPINGYHSYTMAREIALLSKGLKEEICVIVDTRREEMTVKIYKNKPYRKFFIIQDNWETFMEEFTVPNVIELIQLLTRLYDRQAKK